MLKKRTLVAILIVITLMACEITLVSVRGYNNTVSTEESLKADSVNTNFNLRNK